MEIQKTCRQCSTTFSVTKKEAHREFCSRTCYFQNRKYLGSDYKAVNSYERSCKNCGETFSLKSRSLGAKFCSDKCREAYISDNGRDAQLVALNCEHCSKDFKATPKDIKQGRKFCSQICAQDHLTEFGREHTRVERIQFNCRTCDTLFERAPGELAEYHRRFGKDPLYCSRECSHIGRKAVQAKPCQFCGTEFVTEGHSRNRTVTCSDACRRSLQRRNLIARNEIERPSDTREIQRSVTAQGYVRLRFPNQNGVKGREVLEHRYVMEQHLGRLLHADETVHHKVKPTTNNALSNLELFSSRHGPGQRVDEQLDWAIKLLEDYADIASKRGYSLMRVLQTSPEPDSAEHPVMGLFSAISVGEGFD